MKKYFLSLSLLAIGFLWATPAAAQSQSSEKPITAKIVRISGKLSEDGKTFLAKHGQSWAIANPDAVSGQVGHELKLRAQILSASHEIQVLAVKVVATQVRLTANPSDSAFHR